MPALIKVDEIRTKLAKKLDTEIIQNWCNFSGKRHSVSQVGLKGFFEGIFDGRDHYI